MTDRVLIPGIRAQMQGGQCKAFRVGVRVNELCQPSKRKTLELRVSAVDIDDIRRQITLVMQERRWHSFRLVALIEEPATTLLVNNLVDELHAASKPRVKA